jgi:thymidylate kinase
MSNSKQRIVILEGTERTGKTNIAAALSKRTGIPIFKAQVQKKFFMGDRSQFLPFLKFGETTLADFLEQTGTSVILDRNWPSEIVYSEYFSRPTDAVVTKQLDDAYARMGALIVVCTRLEGYAGRVDEDDKTIREEQITAIDKLYKKRVSQVKTRHMFLDTSDEDLERELREIVAALEDE